MADSSKPRSRITRRLLATLVLVFLFLAVSGLAIHRQRLGVSMPPQAVSVGQWIPLSDVEWETASSGWLGVANEQVPARDRAFHGGRLSLDGQQYDKGIGTYPLSEITYNLYEEFGEFQAEVGLDDAALASDAAVRFLVFVDGALALEIGPMRPGDRPRHVQVSLAGASQMRLVVDAPPDRAKAGLSDWADARLLKLITTLGEPQLDESTAQGQERRASQAAARNNDRAAVVAKASAQAAALPEELKRTRNAAERPVGLYDAASERAWLSTGRVALGVGVRRAGLATITLLDLVRQEPVVLNADAAIEVDGRVYVLGRDCRLIPSPDAYTINPVVDPLLGNGTLLVLRLVTRDGLWHPQLRFSLFGNGAMLYEMSLADDVFADQASVIFHYFYGESVAPAFWIDEESEYLSDFSRLRYGRVYDDGILRREPVGGGKPLFIWSGSRPRGVLMSLLEETAAVTLFTIQVEPGRSQGRMGLRAGAALNQPTEGVRSPMLYLERTTNVAMNRAFTGLRHVLDTLFPSAPVPAWAKFQWLSWYAYNMDISEAVIQRQSQYIVANLNDLGAWNLLVDAGWYVSEGRPESGWRTIDSAKFPRGLRPMVNDLHARGQKVVLYLSVPYLDSRQREYDWLGLSGIIERHPEWLLLLGGDENRLSYVFDFGNRDVQDYWSQVMDDFFTTYDVDGIKIDGIGNAEGAMLSPEKLDPFGLVDQVNGQSMPIYRFFYEQATRRKSDAYVESGWLTPTFARPYAHTFRYGDEAPDFHSPYPFPGMVEHIDYAILQKQVLGQRPNMGAIYGDPNESKVNRWWLQAALALGTHVTIGFDLTAMSEETLDGYRRLMTHYEPFTGTTTFGSGLKPRTFATQRGGTTYLGVLNREERTVRFRVPLADHGIAPASATVYDVEADRFIRFTSPYTLTMQPESFRLYIVRQEPGVMWTNSSFEARAEPGGLTVTLRGPTGTAGQAAVAVPQPRAVYMDGTALAVGDGQAPSEGRFAYDAVTGVLNVVYEQRREGRLLRVEY